MHVPVLLDEALQWLNPREGGVYVDCTAGGGGHSEAIARAIGPSGKLLAIDRDDAAVTRVKERLAPFPGVTVRHGDYGDVADLLHDALTCRADGILIDAGVSSYQIDTPERGFSFQTAGPLDMRMDTSQDLTAASLLNSVAEDELTDILRRYGDLKSARKIARAIVDRRTDRPFETTADLADAVREVFHFVSGQPVELRTVFQAVRIAVNREYESLERALTGAIECLNPGGRLVCIAFHSGEDRIIKTALNEAARKRIERLPDGRTKCEHPPLLKVLTKKPITPGAIEIERNPRAQSAKLRAAEKLGAAA